ncbi:hypothetical protein BDV98DRAFT_598453 [Pterulicium gracile]|uniref:Uncharacterized protein n=1 Tax=Pterulicium gracile TaxID=1884261 RepID=A0A5C3Q5U5_9AGAR|nr:hypothetical protein BDV98DRAFT_598453 [Pterula gracilis]
MPLSVIVCRPDNQTSKTVLNGAVSFYLDTFVKSRVARFTYGAECQMLSKPHPHNEANRRIETGVDGAKYVQGQFDIILEKHALSAQTHRAPRRKIVTGHSENRTIDYDVVLILGLTELKAQILWFEKGVEAQGPARLIYPREGV